MSAMLGLEDHGNAAMESRDIDKSFESKNKKKISPSIKNFFKSNPEKVERPASSNNIRKFFLPSPPDKKQDVSKPVDKFTEKKTKQESEDGEERQTTSNPSKKEKKVHTSTKKAMPKWSLTLKGTKNSKHDETESVFEEITEDNFEQNNRLKLKDQIGNCSEENMELKKPKKKEKKKNLKGTTDVVYVEPNKELSLRESKEMLIQEESKITQKEEGNLKELKPSSNEDYPALDTKRKSKKTHKDNLHAKTDCSKSNALETLQKKENALEILMNNSRNTKFNQNECSLEITEVIKPIEEKQLKSKDSVNDHECPMEVIDYKEEGSQEPTKSSTSDTNTANAFDILMMKKSSSENESLKAESQKTSNHKPHSFKLNIRYSKSASESASSDIELDKTIEDSERPLKTMSKKEKKKKKKLEENQDSTLVDKKLSKSSDSSTEKISAKEGGQGQTNVEPKDKMTKVMKKKRKTPKSTDLPARDVPILVQDESNSSVVELIEKTTKKHDSKSNETRSILTSPGIEDFEITPMRKGLRKRTSSINYALMNEPIQTDIKKSKREEKQKKTSDKKKRKTKETEKLEDMKGGNKDKRLKKEKGSKVTAERKQTVIDTEKGTIVNQEKDVSAAKRKGAQGTKKRGPSGTTDKGHSVSKEKGTSGTMEEKTSGIKEKGVSASKEKGAITVREKEATRNKEQGTSGDKKKVTLVIGSDTSPDITEVKSCQSEKKKSEKTSLAPQKLAPIFLKQKPKEKAKSDIKTTQKDLEVTATKTSTEPIKTQPSKQLNEEELKAANTAFLALFASSKTIKAAQKPAVQANQHPTPWPTVSHVTQWSEEDQSNVGKVNQKFAVAEEVTLSDKPKVTSRKLKLGKITSALSEEVVLKKNLRKVNDLERDPLSPAVVKKCLSETSVFFPGVPMRRLYKQYKTKQDEYQTETLSEIQESVPAKKEIKEEKERESSVKDVEDVQEEKPAKRGRSKRKISTQSDEELNEKQIKKARRKKDKEKGSEEKSEDVAKTQVSDQTRKKRGREEDEEEAERSRHAKRKSSRRGDRTLNKEQEAQNDTKPESSKRKKRKTMESELEANSVPSKEDLKSEDSRASVDEKKADLLWTEKYQPECSSEVMGNASSVSRLKSWLEAWKIKREKTLRKELELQKKLLAKQKNKDKQGKKSNPEWREEEYDSDFHLSDEDSEDSDSEDSGLSSAMLVVGPSGSGKTATVYACAKELGYKVFEVNCSSKRSSKQIISKLEEATQSHLVVTNPTANIPKASAFGGLFANVSNNSKASSPLNSFPAKPNKDNDSRSDGKKISGKEKNRKPDGKEKKEKRTEHLVANDSAANPRLASKAVSLILFEEVDLVFEDDKGFWSAVTSFINNAKCPIIMTSNDSHVGCDGRYEQLVLKTPSINLLSAHLQLAALVNNVFVHPNELKTLVSLYKCDIRKCLLVLQFWIMSGAGKKTKWKKFLKENAHESGVKIGSFVTVKSSQSSKDLATPKDTTLAVLVDGGEESLLLTAEDWKRMTTRNTRTSKRTTIAEGKDDDSDFEAQKVCTPAVDENTHTDSILAECSESRSIQVVDDDDKNLVMPGVDCKLVEHTLGLLNTTLAYKNGSVDLLEYRNDVSKMSPLRAKQRLAEYAQSLGVNLINNNLPSLLPTLYTKPSTNQSSSSVAKAIPQPIKTKDEESLDSSVFDDGSESNQGDSNQATGTMETKESIGTEECDSNSDKSDKKEDDTSKRLQKKTLDIFTAIAEDLSFIDAFTANTGLNEYQPAEYGWWHARASSGLSDDVSTLNRTSCDWWTRDSSASIRGALEAASLNCTYLRYRSLVEEGLPSNVQDCLPVQELSSVVNVTGLTDVQSGKVSSTNKLYRTVNSSLPLATFCTRRSTCTEYLPTLRSICHSERLREVGNTKRRFLHYLDSLSSMSNSTMQSLADAYLVP